MQYAIIGGAGFIGSHMVDSLIEKKHNVVVIDNLISGKRDFVNKEAIFEWGDIREPKDLDRIFKKYKFDRVINLAAQPYIPKCYDDPELFFETNANGTLNVLRVCEKYNVEKVLQYASAEEYGTQVEAIKENEAVSPQSTYGVSKVAADYLCKVRHKESGLNVVILRQFNCYGERETHEYVIPEIISQLDKSNIVSLGNIKAERDFLYVKDAAEYAIELLEKGEAGECYNLGSEKKISIEDLANLIAKLWDKEIRIMIDQKKLRPWDIECLLSNNEKIYNAVEYRAKTDLTVGLLNTIKYYKQYGWHF